jgi:hypothetical protein
MSTPDNKRRVLRWDPDAELDGYGMELRLTYAGPLRAHQGESREEQRAKNVHAMRKCFHKQLKSFWTQHPYLKGIDPNTRTHINFMHFMENGFDFLPLVTEEVGVICQVDILMLRYGEPGRVLYDMDNRVKNIFDALRKPKTPRELWFNMPQPGYPPMLPEPDGSETPFFVLLEDDKLITHASVTSDILLEDVDGLEKKDREAAVRLVITINLKPYKILRPSVLVFG